MPQIQSLDSLSKEQLIEIIQQERQAADNQPTLRKCLNPTAQLAITGNGDPELISYERPRLYITIDKTKSLEERLKEYADKNYSAIIQDTICQHDGKEIEISGGVNAPRIRNLFKDAARYLWLRDTCGLIEYKRAFGSVGAGILPSGKILDDAIDAEMEKRE